MKSPLLEIFHAPLSLLDPTTRAEFLGEDLSLAPQRKLNLKIRSDQIIYLTQLNFAE